MREVAVKQKIWKGGELNRDVKKGFVRTISQRKAKMNWTKKPILSFRGIVVIIVFAIVFHWLEHHLHISVQWS